MPEPYARLVDDAAVFPPGNLPLDEALTAHLSHRRAPYRDLLGPFVVTDMALPDLLGLLRAAPAPHPLEVSVVVTGGAGAIEPAARWAGRAGELDLAGLEVALRDEDDLPRNARRVTTVVDRLRASGDLDEDTPVYVEPPRPTGPDPTTAWLDALDEVAAAELRLKFRTGGTSADLFPDAPAVAACIDAALDRELPFKCTAGLHHALRHRDPETGFEHHGFLDVLLATRAALDGGTVTEVADVLETRDAGSVREALGSVGQEGLVSARRWFTSFGSCSVRDPLDDLTALGLLDPAPGSPADTATDSGEESG